MNSELPTIASAQDLYLDNKLSNLKKYIYLSTGSLGIINWLRCELIMALFQNIPGIIGYSLRKIYFPGLFNHCGKDTTFGRNLTIRGSKNIHIGKRVFIDDNCVLDAKGKNASIYIGDNVFIGRNTIIRTREGILTINEGTNIGVNCIISTNSRLSIGKDTLIAAYCYIMGGGMHRFDRVDIPIIKQGTESKGGVIIEDNCWLGADVKVLDGVKIGRDTIIGTGAVVTSDLPEFSIAVGMPAKVIKMRQDRETK